MRSLLYKDWFLIVLAVVIWIAAAALMLPLTYFAFWITTAATVPPSSDSLSEPLVQQREIQIDDRSTSIDWKDCVGVAICVVRCCRSRRCSE